MSTLRPAFLARACLGNALLVWRDMEPPSWLCHVSTRRSLSSPALFCARIRAPTDCRLRDVVVLAVACGSVPVLRLVSVLAMSSRAARRTRAEDDSECVSIAGRVGAGCRLGASDRGGK